MEYDVKKKQLFSDEKYEKFIVPHAFPHGNEIESEIDNESERAKIPPTIYPQILVVVDASLFEWAWLFYR